MKKIREKFTIVERLLFLFTLIIIVIIVIPIISDKIEKPKRDKAYDNAQKYIEIVNKYVEKLKEPINSSLVMNYKVQRRDIDTNNHVNNLYYLDYAIEALPEELYNTTKFSNIEIMYKHEAKVGDTFNLYYSELEEKEYIVTIKDKTNKIIYAIVKLFN